MKELDEYIKQHTANKEKSSSFVEYLYELMDKKKIGNPSEVYNKVFISRQLWSSIISNKSKPSLNVCIKIALGLHLNTHECKYLMKKAGFTLSSSSEYALIIRYAIINKIYDIDKVNDLLMEYGYDDSLIL